MLTKKQVLQENESFKRLINAVINRVGMDNIENINNNGINGGYSGFIYYSDTHAFALRYRKDIIRLLEDMADSLGEEVSAMVNNFGVFNGQGMDNDERKDLYKYLGGGRPEQGQITNVMAWFAAEEVCRMFDR